jgi:hypothetical protein
MTAPFDFFKMLLILLVIFLISPRQCYPFPENCINDYIELESSLIEKASSIEDKLLGYLSRGDSYIIQGEFEKAFTDYHEVSCLVGTLQVDDQEFYAFWSLFGEAIALSNLGNDPLADDLIASIHPLSWNYNSFPIPPVPKILGPETVSSKWCTECAQGLANHSVKYITYVNNERVRQQLLDIVRYLYVQAENCCKLSGLDPSKYRWKDCLGPLNQKRWLWMKKWELYKVPPCPSD